MLTRGVRYAFLISLLLCAAPASTQWTTSMQDAKTGAWGETSLSFRDEQIVRLLAARQCRFGAIGVGAYSAAKIIGPSTETVIPCAVLLQNAYLPAEAPQPDSSTAP